MKKSLLVLLSIAIFWGAVGVLFPFEETHLVYQVSSILYGWIPGLLGLYFAKREAIQLPIFKKLNQKFGIALGSSFGICVFAFVLFEVFFQKNLNFSGLNVANIPKFFLLYYVLFIVLYSIFFLGGELYWRGYLWEKLKAHPFRAVWLIALFWSIWLIPTAIFFESSSIYLFLTPLQCFVLAPVLLYYRITGKNIITPTLFYSSLFSAQSFLFVLFQITEKIYVFQCFLILLVFIYGLTLRLYSKKRWSEITINKN